MSEVRRQLSVLECAVAVARATVGSRGVTDPWDFSALLKAAAFIDSSDAAVSWIQTSEFASDPHFRIASSHGNYPNYPQSIADARTQFEAALERFNALDARSHEFPARGHLNSVATAARTAEELALPIALAHRAFAERGEARGPLLERKVEEAKIYEQSAIVHRQIEELINEPSVRRTTLELLPAFMYGPGEDLPILRMKQESPLEVVVILIGSAGALVALLNGLLDVQVKYKTRTVKARAERSRLERELAEDQAKAEALKELRTTFSANEPERLKIQDFTVFDSLEEAFEDDEEMKAT